MSAELQLLQPLLTKTLGHRLSPATIWRHVNKGVLVGSARVKLRATRCGGRLYGTADDVAAFIAAQNPPATKTDDSQRDAETHRRLESSGLI